MSEERPKFSVRWQNRNGKDMVPGHGFEFWEDTGINTVYNPSDKYPLAEFARHWFDYTVALADEKFGCIRVWVDGEIVWDWKNDWYYSMPDLRARVWRGDGGSSPEAEDVQDTNEGSAC